MKIIFSLFIISFWFNILGINASVCLPCFEANVLAEMGEPLLAVSSCLLQPVIWAVVRSYIRGKYNIKGSICTDFIVACFCPTLTVLQIKNENDSRVSDVGVSHVHENI